MRYSIRLKGSVLSYTIFISVAITIIIFSIFLESGIKGYYQTKLIKSGEIREDIDIALNMMLEFRFDQSNDNVKYFLNDPSNPVQIFQKKWGFYDIIGARKIESKITYERIAITGFVRSTDSSTLYIVDNGSPLLLIGDCKISGDIYIGAKGVRQGFISNLNPFSGERLINGEINKSDRSMPANFDLAKAKGSNFLNQLSSYSDVEYISINDGSADFKNSFGGELKSVFEETSIELRDISLTGQILVESNKSVIIYETACLEDIIVKAPFIEIKEGFKGTLQCFATDSIIIHNNCKLEYPSVLSLMNQTTFKTHGNLIISDSSRVDGLVLLSTTRHNQDNFILIIGDETQINGQVFSNGLLELKGDLNGKVVSRQTIVTTQNGIYDNYLSDVHITPIRNSYFLYIIEDLNATEDKEILRWVN